MQTSERPLAPEKELHRVRPGRVQRWAKHRWDDIVIIGYGLQARWEALGHEWRGHEVHWRKYLDLWSGGTGDIVCVNCPDSNDGQGGCDVVFWMRTWRWMSWIGMRVCGLLGHPLFQHPKRYDAYVEDEVYCYRCCWGGQLRKVWLEDAEESD